MINKLATVNQKLSPSLRKIIGNIAWLSTDKILRLVLGLLVGVWVARYLGPGQFGLYNYAITFVALFSPLAELGLRDIMIRDVARDSSCKEQTLGTAFALRLASGILTLLLAVSTISLLQPKEDLTRWLVVIVALGTIFQAFDTIDFWFQSQVQSKYTVLARNTAYVLICLARVVLIQIHAPLIAFMWASLAEVALGAVGLVVVYQLKGHNIMAWQVSLARAKKLLQESWPLIFAGLSVYIYSKIDQVMLGSFLQDKSELGFYSIAVKISEIFDFLPGMLASSILPKLAELKSKNNDSYTENMQIYFDIMVIMWLAVAIPVSLFSSFIVTFMYGNSYAASASILSLYVWAQFGTNFGLARGTFLTIEGMLSLSIYICGIGAITNIVLNLYLIPKFGAFGATLATLITYFIVNVLLNFIIKKLRFIGMLMLRSLNVYQAASRILGLVK